MPRLRPINFENFTRDEAIRMVKDILMKYPRGPLQRQKRAEYGEDYRDTYLLASINEDTNRADADALRWGYTDEHAYQCIMQVFGGARPSQWDVRHKLWEMHPEWSKHKATRASNRFWSRLGRPCQSHIENLQVEKLFCLEGKTPCHFVKEGEFGVGYALRSAKREYSTEVRVSLTAGSKEEATMAAGAMFGHALNDLHVHESVTWKESNEGDAVTKNVAALERIEEKKVRIARTIKALRGQLQELEMVEEAIQLYNVTIFSEDN
jgi:hypothetical protein